MNINEKDYIDDKIDTAINNLKEVLEKDFKKLCYAIGELEKRAKATEKVIEDKLIAAASDLDRRLEILSISYKGKVERYDEDVRELREAKAKMEGKADQKQVNTLMILTVVSILIALGGAISNVIR
jgi:hypothetical protein